jgi:prepilin-type N-terminal cleavage/methylation domain-containing protein
MKNINKNKAFTLIELVIVLAIVGIVATIAVPAFQGMIASYRISGLTSTLHAAFILTRNEAINRGGNVAICRAVNADITPLCTNVNSNALINTGWAEGWIIYKDVNVSGNYEPAVDILINIQGPMLTDPKIGSITPNPQRQQFVFNSTGQSFGAFVRFSVSQPDNMSSSYQRFICVAAGGRARVSKDTCTSS